MLKDLRSDLHGLASRLTASRRKRIMLVAARPREGTSSLAVSLASLLSEDTAKPVWLIDLALRENALYERLDRGQGRPVLGRPDRVYDASLQVSDTFYKLSPLSREVSAPKLLTVHDIPGSNLFVTRFRTEHLSKGQSVALQGGSAWWDTLASSVEKAIIDAPALSRSKAALTVARDMDGIVLVVEADRTSAADVKLAQKMILKSGGKLIGVAMNQVQKDAQRQARRL